MGTLASFANRLSLGKIRREENALWSFAPHDISMILALTKQAPTHVVASGGYFLHSDIADTTLSHFQFPGSLQAHIFVSWLHPYKDHRMVVVGAEGMLVFDDTQPPEKKLSIYSHIVDLDGSAPIVNRADSQPVEIEWCEPLRRECEVFLDAVMGNRTPPSDGAEGVRVIRVLDACQQALVTGARVELAPQPTS